MKKLEEAVEITEKTSEKILKILEKIDDPEAFAILNYCFTRLLVQRIDDPRTMKAAILTFTVNSASSIDDIVEMSDAEDGHIH
jgi:predicted lactoylglutathione lyase